MSGLEKAGNGSERGDGFCFGYWPEGAPDIDLAQARAAMVEMLAERLPPPPRRVVLIAQEPATRMEALAGRGYRVEVLKPAALMETVGQMQGRGDAEGESWDAAIVYECLQDLTPLDAVLAGVRHRLAPSGRLVIVGEICQDLSLRALVNIPSYKEIVVALLEGGYRINSTQAIGHRVFPTFGRISETGPGGGKQDPLRNRPGWRLKHERHASQQLGYQLFVATKDEIFIRTYREGDEAHILALFKRAFGTPRSLAHWRWKFADNPFGRLRIAEAVSAEGILAAHFCGYPVPFHSNHGPSRELITFHSGDTMTHPEFRGSGRGLTAVLSRIAEYFYNRFCVGRVPFIYGFNTGKIRRFGERFLEYEYIPEVRFHTLPVDGLDFRAFSVLARSVSGLRVVPVTRIDDEFDRFFDEVCDDYGMLVKRSADYLRWRYLDCPDAVHRLFALRRFGRLMGWGVFSRRADVLVWGDALFAKRAAGSLRFFIAYLVNRVYTGIERVEAWFSPQPAWWAEAVSEAGFDIGPEPNRLAPAFRIFDRTFSTTVFEHNLYYSMGDSDMF